ncbi:MAG TPA: LLM class flavin-dependent oxidoreductase, partial [Ktedonobacteraceae bacterium]|nr:LLM class flavin-dependent oxidoreductase [Ktedonobacteraceae bacterium]
AEEIWKSAGRPGKPRLVGCSYIALGQNGLERGGAAIRDYYSFMGPRVEGMISALPTTLDAIRDIVNGFADIGTDEVVLWPTTPDLEQIDQLAELADLAG